MGVSRTNTFSCGMITFGRGGQPKVDVDVHLRQGDVFEAFFMFTPYFGKIPSYFSDGLKPPDLT